MTPYAERVQEANAIVSSWVAQRREDHCARAFLCAVLAADKTQPEPVRVAWRARRDWYLWLANEQPSLEVSEWFDRFLITVYGSEGAWP